MYNVGSEEEFNYCPKCGHSLKNSFSLLNGFWRGEETVFFCWCSHCFWKGEIVDVGQMITTEPE